MARMQSIFTSLIFDHSLRVRLKSDVAEKESSGTSATPGGDSLSAPDTPDESPEREDEDANTVHSRLTTDASTATADTTVVAPEASTSASTTAPKDKGKDGKAEDVEKTSEAKKADNFSGKLNNLVTSDLENIVSGRDFLFIRESLLGSGLAI